MNNEYEKDQQIIERSNLIDWQTNGKEEREERRQLNGRKRRKKDQMGEGMLPVERRQKGWIIEEKRINMM